MTLYSTKKKGLALLYVQLFILTSLPKKIVERIKIPRTTF